MHIQNISSLPDIAGEPAWITLLNTNRKRLLRARSSGALKFIKLGKSVLYRKVDILAFLQYGEAWKSF